MRFVLLVVGLLAGWVASAGAGLPALPPVPTLPQIPTLPVLPPPPRAPQVPQVPQVPQTPVPRAPVVPPVSQPSLPAVGGGGATPSNRGSAAGPSSSHAPARHAASRPARVHRLHFSRNWISRTGPKQRRQTVLMFVLRRAALVEFVVIEVAPDCRRIGRFRVSGQPGVNRVRFRGRIGRRVLATGTYRIVGRTFPRGRSLVETKLVIVSRPERNEIAAARSANACGSRAQGQSTSSTSSALTPTSTPAKPGAATAPRAQGKAEKPARPSRAQGVLGARFTQKAVDAVKSIPLWLFALLVLAIALLAVAALPLKAAPTRETAVALAHHRGIVALGGAALLAAVTVAYTLH